MESRSKKLNNRDRVRLDGKFLSRGGQRTRLQGVSYGPFQPNENGEQFPAPDTVRNDFALMRKAGINSIRTYYVPPEWFLDIADEEEILIFVDVPWSKHLCFFDNHQAQNDARKGVREAAERGKNHPSVIAYSIGNEIPSDIIRWYGARRVERFIQELMDVVKNIDPNVLVTYANYPPTEYLNLSFLDFITFNVYLHDLETFRRYLIRLQNLVGDKPLVLGEIGMDTLRQGEKEQAQFLTGHIKEAILIGLAGSYVFSWTDDWYTGGYQIEDWAFGITTAKRFPKPSYYSLKTVFGRSPAKLLDKTPRVSVVVCSYNGGGTLDECLDSLLAIDYPNYETILVDDGSKDNTLDIVKRFPDIRVIHQDNKGLSVARNVGLQISSGSIIAYTDSDCFADQDWLTHLVYQLERSDAAAVGGPNFTPEDGWIAACIDSSPGQPTHVLENDQMAEHIPGCNMAYRREALEAINGFDPQFSQAGDDVDVCWRLQQAGFWITFAPSAFVWHHRRQTPRAYLRQQAGYGKAEALLHFKHPDKFNNWGQGKWRGVIYGNSLQGLHLGRSIIYRGTFGTGLFQTIYQPGPAHWTLLPSSLEWHGVAAAATAAVIFWPPALMISIGMIGLSLAVAGLQAAQAQLPAKHKGLKSRLLIATLSYVQPLIRSWKRYMTRISFFRGQHFKSSEKTQRSRRLPLSGIQSTEYWTEDWRDRTELLNKAKSGLITHGWKTSVDSGWTPWDLEIHFSPWTVVRICTVQEDHGSGKRLIRIKYRLRLSVLSKLLVALSLVSTGFAIGFQSIFVAIIAGLSTCGIAWVWRKGLHLASRVTEFIDRISNEISLFRCDSSSAQIEKSKEPIAHGGVDYALTDEQKTR